MKQNAIKLEDYLEAIAELGQDGAKITEKEIARHFNVAPSDTSSVLLNLLANQLIEYSDGHRILLTPAGAVKANAIRNRHATMKRFFSDILKLDMETANRVACDVEHLMDETVLSRVVALTDAIAGREDCSALRAYLSQTMPQLQADDTLSLVPLNKLPKGECGIVVRVDDALRGLKKFSDLGLVRGSLVQLVGGAPFGDLMRIKVMSTSLSLRSSDAAHIWVRPTNNNDN